MKTILYIFLLTTSFVSAQNITTKLVDEENKPLAAISIEIENSAKKNYDLTSDENGIFNFEIEQASSFTIYIK